MTTRRIILIVGIAFSSTELANGQQWQQIHMIQGGVSDIIDRFCIEVRGDDYEVGNKLVLGECDETRDSQQFWFDPVESAQIDSLIRTKANPSVCVGVREVSDHSWLRLEICNEGSLNQIWLFGSKDGSSIRPLGDDGLVVTYLGVNPDIGDPIMLKSIDGALLVDGIPGWTLEGDLINVKINK